MLFRIHFEYADGTEDYFDVEGETVEDIRNNSNAELERRGASNPWSEELS